jgi:hypothetical protein
VRNSRAYRNHSLARGRCKGLTRFVIKQLSCVVFLMACGFATPAAAYIDPNIGGQIYQALYPVLALLLGVLAFARQWVAAIWHRCTSVIRSLLSRE